MNKIINENNLYLCPMETNRQKKIAGVLQQELALVLQKAIREQSAGNLIVSITKVMVTKDLSLAKVYVSVFPTDKISSTMEALVQNTPLLKHQLSQNTKNQLRKMPDLTFFYDDSITYMENIEKSLKGDENPIANPNLLVRRKKS